MLPARYPNEIETNAPIRIGSAGAAGANCSPNRSVMIGSAATIVNASAGSEPIVRYSPAVCSSSRARARSCGNAVAIKGNRVVITEIGMNWIWSRIR